MIFHHGFFGSGAAAGAGCSAFCATVLAVVIVEIWGETWGETWGAVPATAGAAGCGVAAMAVGCTDGVAGRMSGAPVFSAEAGESDGGSRVTFSPRARAALHAETSLASAMP